MFFIFFYVWSNKIFGLTSFPLNSQHTFDISVCFNFIANSVHMCFSKDACSQWVIMRLQANVKSKVSRHKKLIHVECSVCLYEYVASVSAELEWFAFLLGNQIFFSENKFKGDLRDFRLQTFYLAKTVSLASLFRKVIWLLSSKFAWPCCQRLRRHRAA